MAIETLGEIRAKYNFWNKKERPYYEALSEAIRVLNAQKDKCHYAKIVRCGDCKYRPHWDEKTESVAFPIPDRCPCECEDFYYSWIPNDDWFCADGEREVQE